MSEVADDRHRLTTMSRLGDLRDLITANRGRLRVVLWVVVAAAAVGVAVYLSTVDLDGDDGEGPFEGSFFLGLIPWIMVVLVGWLTLRWLQRSQQRRRARNRDT